MIIDIFIKHAITKKDDQKYTHWLDKAQDKYEVGFIEDVKAAFRVLVLYIPLPIFWALFDQQVVKKGGKKYSLS